MEESEHVRNTYRFDRKAVEQLNDYEDYIYKQENYSCYLIVSGDSFCLLRMQ